MGNLYNNIEIINMTLIISIMCMCFMLYKVSKDMSYLSISLIYLIELCLSLYSIKYNNMQNFIYLLKALLFMLFSKYTTFSKNLNIRIIIISLISIICPTNAIKILLDFEIIRFIINKIKKYSEDLHKSMKKLKLNNDYLISSSQKIELEHTLQNEYKNNINKLNERVSISIEQSDMPIFVLNHDKKFIYNNKCFEDMIKKDNFYNEDFDIHTYMNKKFINSDDIKNITHEQNINLISYDDKIFRFMSVTDIIDSKKITICILKDITQSTLIQNKLKESEQRYRNLMDILNDGVIIHNMNTISYINTSAKEIFSLDKNSDKIWLIDDINNQLNIQYREKFLKSINMIQTGKKDKVSVKVETEEGKIIEFISTSIILNEKQMVISLAIDITNSEKTMMELEQTEKTYKLLLQTLPEGIAIIDKKTKNHVYRNKAMIKLLKNIGADDLSKVVNDYIEKKEFGKFKKISINSDKKHDISIAIIDILEEGTYLVVIRNLENTVKIEKMVEKLSEIKAKYKFKTEFLANVTQDIKRPINIISNVNNILDINKEKYNSENVNNYIKAVRQNCNRLLRILENTEEIEAIENGNYKMNYSKVNIVKLIKNIVKISKVYTDEKGLKVNFTTNINNKILFIDKSKMEKVILNILANAIKFTPSGGTINIDIKVINSKVHISIKDSGVGIPQDKINVIFENFEQVDRTLTRGAEGTGIGLALTQKLVQLHDGKIVVTSEIGLGSNFEIILNDNEFDKVFDNIKFFDNSIDKEKIDLEFSDIYLI